MPDLQSLAESQPGDRELVPDILPTEAKLSFNTFTDHLASLIQRAMQTIPQKEVIPGTSMALIEAIAATKTSLPYVRISASDGAQWVQVVSTRQVNVIVPGAVLVPAKKFSDILKLAPHKASRVEVVGTEMSIRSGRARWRVQTPVGDRLAAEPSEETWEEHVVPVGAFRGALRAVSRAVDPNSPSPAFRQAHVALGAVTGTRGPVTIRHQVYELHEDVTFDVPGGAIPQVLALMDGVEPDLNLEVGTSAERVRFRMGADTLIVNRLNVRWREDITQVILGAQFTNEHSIVVEREDFLAAIKRVRVNADPDWAAIVMTTVPIPGDLGWHLAIRARDSVGNAAQEVIDCQWSGSGVREVVLNHKHLAEVLASVHGEDVVMKVGPDSKTQRYAVHIEAEQMIGVIAQMTRY